MKLNRIPKYRGDSSSYDKTLYNESLYIEKEVRLRDYLRVLRQRKTSVYTAFIVIMILTLVVTYSKTPLYEASAKLLIEQNTKNPLLSDYGLTRQDPEFLATQTQIIKSTSVSRKVVRMLDLETTYDDFYNPETGGFSLLSMKYMLINFIGNVKKTCLKIIGGSVDNQLVGIKEDMVDRNEEIARKISDEISVRPTKNSRIVTLNYMAANPVLATKIVNCVAKAYIDKTFDMKMESYGYNLKWMTEKADEEKEKLEKSEHALQKYMEENDIVTIENRITITPQKLAQINRRLIETQTRSKELKAVYKSVRRLPENLKGAESIQVIYSDPIVRSLRKQNLMAEKNIMDLSRKYGPKHPVMQRALADLEILREKRKQEIMRAIQSVKEEYDLVCANEREFENLLAQIKHDAVKINEKFIQYGILMREVETNKQLYNALITKIKEQNVAEQAQSIKVWVVEKAKIPGKPARPNKKRNMMLGIILAVFGGIGLALFLEHLDNTVKYPEDVEEHFDLPVLGSVALLKLNGKQMPEKEVLENPTTTFAEGFKSIRAAVMLSSAGASIKRLLVTSVAPCEGKTTSVINLAVSMAQAERSVLLIDADFRKPRIHSVMEIENDKGLSNFLAGTSDKNIIQKGPHEYLDIITSGPIPLNPSELLSSKRIEEFIQMLQKKYDVILFDSPPVLMVSDALIIGQLVEGIILIARFGKTSCEAFKKGQRTLENIGGRIIGTVLNAVETKNSNY